MQLHLLIFEDITNVYARAVISAWFSSPSKHVKKISRRKPTKYNIYDPHNIWRNISHKNATSHETFVPRISKMNDVRCDAGTSYLSEFTPDFDWVCFAHLKFSLQGFMDLLTFHWLSVFLWLMSFVYSIGIFFLLLGHFDVL